MFRFGWDSKIMDDSEYYRITNRTSLPVDIAKIVRMKKERLAAEKAAEAVSSVSGKPLSDKPLSDKSVSENANSKNPLTPRTWAVSQGREDAEMLYEKNASPDA